MFLNTFCYKSFSAREYFLPPFPNPSMNKETKWLYEQRHCMNKYTFEKKVVAKYTLKMESTINGILHLLF